MQKIFFTISLLLMTVLTAQSQISRIEPPFWWENMKTNQIQLCLYGKNIQNAEIRSSQLKIKDITKTENPNYLFVTLDLSQTPAGKYSLEYRLSDTKYTTVPFDILERRPDSQNRKGFDASDVIYLLMPDRFANGNAKNDQAIDMKEKTDRSKSGGRHGGDIAGIINNLDYLSDLGATAIWGTPLCEDNDATYSYHGYAQSNVYRIDPRYGTNEDYRKLGQELHKRDMKLIMDYVTNHWGLEHWMIKDLPTYEWIHQFPGYAQTNYRMTTQFDPNASKIDAKMCMDGWFVPTMPDLNQNNPLLLQYLIQNAIWWVEYADLDGFRVDTYSYCDKDGISTWTKAIMDEYPNFNIVGEVWMHDQAQIAYWQKDSKIGAIQNYNSYLPSVMDFTLHDAILLAFGEKKSTWFDGMIKVYENFCNDFLYPNPNNLLIFAENHDTRRIHEVYGHDVQTYKLILSLLATTRGIPQLYYGTEIGMGGDKNLGDGDIRQDFPGGWPDDPQNAFLESGRTETQRTYFDLTKKAFSWRKNAKAVHEGKLLHYLPEENVYVYFRILGEDRIMTIINNSESAQTIKMDRFSEGLGTSTSGKDIWTEQTINLSKEITISGRDAYILEL